MAVAAPHGSLKLGPFLVASAVAHLLALGIAVGADSCGSPQIDLEDRSVKTRLVKLGKKRNEKLLPRIERKKEVPKPQKPAPVPKAPEPEPAKTKASEPAPNPEPPPKKVPEAKPEPADKRSAKDILSDFAKDEEEKKKPKLTDLVRDVIDEGDEEGSEIGEEIEGRLKATYNDKIRARIKNALKVPKTIGDAERLRLKARLYVAIGPGGELLSTSIKKASDNPAFDNAVLAAAKNSDPFPPPPIQVRDFYARGVQMNVCPISCR